jgi:hypothetical protein
VKNVKSGICGGNVDSSGVMKFFGRYLEFSGIFWNCRYLRQAGRGGLRLNQQLARKGKGETGQPRIPQGGTNEHEAQRTRRLVMQSGMRYVAAARFRSAVSWRDMVPFGLMKWVGGHTTSVLVFAGMNGNPIGGFLFSHVPYFKGAMNCKQKEKCRSSSTIGMVNLGDRRDVREFCLLGCG